MAVYLNVQSIMICFFDHFVTARILMGGFKKLGTSSFTCVQSQYNLFITYVTEGIISPVFSFDEKGVPVRVTFHCIAVCFLDPSF